MIYLIGFSGVGKTSVAKKLAKDLNLKYMDTDELIEKKYKASIKKIFEKSGEIYFREIESDILKKIKILILFLVVADYLVTKIIWIL